MCDVLNDERSGAGVGGGRVQRVVDCRRLRTDRWDRAHGHIGFHPQNLATILLDHRLRTWRVTRYLELYHMLFDDTMLVGDTQFTRGYFCEKGCHRSVAWALIEGHILLALGFHVSMQAVCHYHHTLQRCQRHGVCEACNHDDNAVTQRIMRTAVDEFFEVMVVADVFLPE